MCKLTTTIIAVCCVSALCLTAAPTATNAANVRVADPTTPPSEAKPGSATVERIDVWPTVKLPTDEGELLTIRTQLTAWRVPPASCEDGADTCESPVMAYGCTDNSSECSKRLATFCSSLGYGPLKKGTAKLTVCHVDGAWVSCCKGTCAGSSASDSDDIDIRCTQELGH